MDMAYIYILSCSGVRDWLEANFTTSTDVVKTVGRLAMMGVLKEYFEFWVMFECGIPSVTLEGTVDDWKLLRNKASHLKSFNDDILTHWAKLLKYVLGKFIDSYRGEVDETFWSHIFTEASWGSGWTLEGFQGWASVFIPFHHQSGRYILEYAKPKKNKWPGLPYNHIRGSTVEVPVKINDNGREYDTIFYGGHLMSVYDPIRNSLMPSMDWMIIDITDKKA